MIYNTDAVYLGELAISNFGLLIVVILLLGLVLLLLYGIPMAIREAKK